MKSRPYLSVALLSLATVFPSRGAEIDIPDHSFAPDGSTTAAYQQTDISTPNGGNVLPAGASSHIAYFVTTFTFGESSDAHLQANFRATGGQARVGVEVQDSGLVQFVGTGDSTQTNFNLSQDMAGESVTILVKAHYDPNHNVTYGKANASDDTLFNAWINPTTSSVEGSGQSAGDMQTVWNSATFGFFGQTIQNQSTPGTAGESFITGTVVLTGADATFANALALATGSSPPTGIVDPGTSTVFAAPTAVPADDTTTATITVTLKDAGGNPVSGKEVSLSSDGGASIETGDNTSDANGEVVFTVRSNDPGMQTFTATDVTDSNLVLTQTASVDFQEVVAVGPVDAGTSSVVASPASIPANGVATSTVTVTLRDANSLAVAGEGVTLSGSPSGATIAPSSTGTTDANGEAVFTVSSSSPGLVTFSATSSTDSTTVTQTAAVDFLDPTAPLGFNVNFIDEGQADATGLVGVVGDPGETWNQGTTSVGNLVDSTGTVNTSVSVSGLGNDGRTLAADLAVFNGTRNVFGKGSDVTISITGLVPDAAYDLYIYSLSHNASPWGDVSNTERAAGDFVTTNTVNGNGQSQFLDNGTTGTSDDVFIPGGNYVVFQSIIADGSGDISVVADAHDGADGDPGTNDGNTRLHVSALQIRPATGASADYLSWRDTYYPGLGLPGEDDDGDTLSNDYERIFGLDPTDPSSVNPYTTPFDSNGSFSYSRRGGALNGLNYKVWYSTDLGQWFEDNAANQLVDSVSNGVEIVDVDIDPALLAQPKLFIQLRTTPVTGVDPEPTLVNLWGSGSTITLLFSEPMNPSSAANPTNYSVLQDGAGSVTVTDATLSSDGGSVTLTLGSPLGLDTGYTVDLDGVTSGTGQSLGSGVSRQFTTWDDDPAGVKVFILAGQSNMVGFGSVEDGNSGPGTIGSLRYQAIDNASFPEYDYASLLVDPGQPSTSPFRTRSDVKVWYRDGGNGQLGGAIKKGDLGPPFMGRDTGKIGPEFAFGQVLGDYYVSHDVLIVKCSWGGRDLAKDFRSPSAVANRGGQVGDFFSATIDYTRQVLANLGTEFPASWSGTGYEIVGFGWHQGYNDRISTQFSAEYRDNLPDFIDDMRTVFNKPDLPFVIATTGMGGLTPIATEPNPDYSSYTEVERAQLWDYPGIPRPANVLSSDTRPFWQDAASSPTDQGFHWNQNGYTYFRIGKAMGDDMVDLLTP